MKSTVSRSIVFILLLAATAVIYSGCKEKEIYPVIPFIKFKDAYVVKDSTGEPSLIGLIINYRDGDGDIGLSAGDTFAPFNIVQLEPNGPNVNYFYNNLYIDYLEKDGDTYQYVVKPFSTDTLRKSTRVMNLTPDGKYKAIRGDIDIQFEPSLYPDRRDTIKLKVKLIDRSLNISNEIETPDIILR